jgi:hypothetical protein
MAMGNALMMPSSSGANERLQTGQEIVLAKGDSQSGQ